MTFDSQMAIAVTLAMPKVVAQLKAEKTPLPYGIVCKYQAFIPKKTPDEILESETDPYWFWYAEELRELISTLDATPKLAFVAKKSKST